MPPPSIIWINGSLVPLEEARISPLDHGFLVGDGVFETLVANEGKPFAARRHWQRLAQSCAQLGLRPLAFETFLAAMLAVLEANELTEARVRVTMTSGDGPIGSERGAGQGTVVVIATRLTPWPPTERVMLVPWTRNETGALAGVKSTSYAENVRALAYAKANGCGEALMANTRGELCEGTGSNVFVVHDGRLVTPPLASGCLAGITRALVLEACRHSEIECAKEPLPVAVLNGCEEAFLCSTTRNVHPIADIGGRSLRFAPGSITRRVQAAFAEYVGGFAGADAC